MFHLDQRGTGDGANDLPWFIEDSIVAAKVTGVMIGHSELSVRLELEFSLADEFPQQ